MMMPGRVFGTNNYRYGFNTQEKDNEVSGNGNSYTAEFWQYDSRLVRRWNIDPVVKPHESPYLTFSGNPIFFVDPNGDNATGYTVDKEGNIEKVDNTGGDKYDVIWEKDEYEAGNRSYDYKGTGNTGIRINDKSFVPGLSEAKPEAIQKDAFGTQKYQGYYSTIKGRSQAMNVFKFLSDATSLAKGENGYIGIEWSLLGTTDGEWVLGTLKQGSQGFNFSKLSQYSDLKKHSVRAHSHPGATWDSFTISGNDYSSAEITRKHNPNTKFYVYMPELTMARYNSIITNKYYQLGKEFVKYPLLQSEPPKLQEY